MIKVIVTGAACRMGSRIVALALADGEIELAGAVESPGHPAIGRDAGVLAGGKVCGVMISDALDKVIERGDVAVDFSLPEATLPNLNIAAKFKKGMVVGTTGHSPSQRQGIE